MAFNWFSAITNNTEILPLSDPRILQILGQDNLWDDEQIVFAFCYVRDMVIMTNCRLIDIDVQKLRGKKIRRTFHTWSHMTSFSVENCGGTFDGDHDITVEFRNYNTPFELQVQKKFDIAPVTRFLSQMQRQSV